MMAIEWMEREREIYKLTYFLKEYYENLHKSELSRCTAKLSKELTIDSVHFLLSKIRSVPFFWIYTYGAYVHSF